MNELDSCLSVISLDYQIDSLKFLSFALADMGDVMLEFNNELDIVIEENKRIKEILF